jgi:hypothetical protein
LIAAIAAVDVPLGLWPDMIPVLLSNVTNNPNNPNLKRASLEAIGYVCEEIVIFFPFVFFFFFFSCFHFNLRN